MKQKASHIVMSYMKQNKNVNKLLRVHYTDWKSSFTNDENWSTQTNIFSDWQVLHYLATDSY